MKTVYKYVLDINAKSIEMPHHAKILKIGVQGKDIVAWAEVETDNICDAIVCHRNIQVFMTGEAIPEKPYERVYHGTVQLPNGIVAHIMEWL